LIEKLVISLTISYKKYKREEGANIKGVENIRGEDKKTTQRGEVRQE